MNTRNHTTRTAPVTALALALLQACAAEEIATPAPELDAKEQAFRWAAAGDHDHADMTKTALSFLKSSVAEQIGDGNEYADSRHGPYKLLSRYHVDNCRISEAFDTINSTLEQTAAAFNPAINSGFDAVASFGLLTHTAQDFYAHSNWVEGGQTAILGRGALAWPRGNPGEVIEGMLVMAQGSPNVTATRAAGSRVPFVTVGGVTRPVLMTGTYADNTDAEICPNSVQLPHGDFLNWNATTAYDTFLAKDGPYTPHHDDAVAMAMRQTREEFCRLDRVVGIKFGFQGQQKLRTAWVNDMNGFRTACPNNDDLVAALIMAGR